MTKMILNLFFFFKLVIEIFNFFLFRMIAFSQLKYVIEISL